MRNCVDSVVENLQCFSTEEMWKEMVNKMKRGAIKLQPCTNKQKMEIMGTCCVADSQYVLKITATMMLFQTFPTSST